MNNQIRVGKFNPNALRHGHGGCQITSCHLSVDGHAPASKLYGGQQVTLHVEAQADREVAQPIFGFIFRNDGGQNLFGDNSYQRYMNDPVPLASW
jgi:lipopolysaccharide transport system ATP-binding protein